MSFLAIDPPRHGRMRALVSRGFTPRRVAELEPRIRELTRRHLAPALDGDAFDFVGDLAGKLPMDVVSELLGVPVADRDELRRLSDLLVHREDGVHDVPPAGIEAAITLVGYYTDMLDERRRRRTDDLTSALLDAEIDGDRLTDDEIIGFLFLMVVAGNETTTKLLANAWYWAWRNPDERAKPFGDPDRIGDWVEETLRYDTSSQVLARTATEDIEVAGGVIPDGGRVLLLVGSANRDDAVFPDGDRYDLDRDTTRPRQLRGRSALLPRRIPGPARGAGLPRRAGGLDRRLRHRRGRRPGVCTRSTCEASPPCPPRWSDEHDRPRSA